MGIPLGSNFSVQTALPLDDRQVVTNSTSRDAIPSLVRYEGMIVFVIADQKNYQLVGGTANANWKQLSSGSGQGGINYITNYSAEDDAAGYVAYKSQVVTGTFNASTDQFTTTAGTEIYPDNLAVVYTASVSAAGGLTSGLTYYVSNVGSNPGYFRLRPSPGASEIDITSTGSGTHTLTPNKTLPYQSGGTPTTTWTRSTSAPLRGLASFLLTKGAADYQGEGVYYPFTIDSADKGQILDISFDFAIVSGTYSGGTTSTDSDVVVTIVDVTNNIIVQPAIFRIDGSSSFKSNFLASATSTSYRIHFHIATASTSAYTLKFDNLAVGPSTGKLVIPASSDWEAYTPTFTGFGTVTVQNFRSRRDGPDLIVDGTFTTAGASAVEARVSLPPGRIISSTVPTLSVAGSFAQQQLTSDNHYVLKEPGASYMTFSEGSTATAATAKANASTITGSGQRFYLNARFPIEGWTSGYTTAGMIAQNVPVKLSAYKNAGSISADTTIPTWSEREDSANAFDASTGIFTVPTPGDYQINFKVSTTSGTPIPSIRLGGTVRHTGLAVSSKGIVSGLLTGLVVGNTITVTINSALTGSSTDVDTTLEIFKVNSPSSLVSVPKIAYVKDIKAANTAGGTATSGSFATRDLNTLEGDRSFISLASNQFTLQPGQYKIRCMAHAYNCNSHRALLYNATLSANTNLLGSTAYSNTTGNGQTYSFIVGQLLVTSQTAFEIRHRVQTTATTTGWGTASNFGIDEVYTVVEIEKIL